MSRHDRTRQSGAGGSARRGSGRGPGNPRAHPVELRLRVVQQVVDEGAPITDVARVFGLGISTISDWVKRYQESGLDGLVPRPLVRPAAAKTPDPRREAVTALKEEHPEYGTRRIAD